MSLDKTVKKLRDLLLEITSGLWLIEDHKSYDKRIVVGPVSVDNDDVPDGEGEANAKFVFVVRNSESILDERNELLARIDALQAAGAGVVKVARHHIYCAYPHDPDETCVCGLLDAIDNWKRVPTEWKR